MNKFSCLLYSIISGSFTFFVSPNAYEGFVELLKKCKEQKMAFCWYYPVISSEKPELPKEVEEQLKDIPDYVLEHEYEGRTDLREEVIFTIDGDDTKDIDDAISIEKLDNGNYKLGVHIADVSYYVTENSYLDKDALERGTSSYLADSVIPMLPHKLSNGICSLNPNVDRLTRTCEMEINSRGEVVNYDIYLSVINSKKAMKYSEVNSVLKGEQILGYDKYVEQLNLMKELSDILDNARKYRNYIDFDIADIEIMKDDVGCIKGFAAKGQGEAEKIIEKYMDPKM